MLREPSNRLHTLTHILFPQSSKVGGCLSCKEDLWNRSGTIFMPPKHNMSDRGTAVTVFEFQALQKHVEIQEERQHLFIYCTICTTTVMALWSNVGMIQVGVINDSGLCHNLFSKPLLTLKGPVSHPDLTGDLDHFLQPSSSSK